MRKYETVFLLNIVRKFNGINLFRDKSYTLVNKNAAINWTDSKAEVDALSASDPNNISITLLPFSELEQAVPSIRCWHKCRPKEIPCWTDLRERQTAVLELNFGVVQGMVLIGHGSDDGDIMDFNWGNGEPNSGGEHYLQIFKLLQPDGSTGAWNDLADTRTSGPTYQPLG